MDLCYHESLSIFFISLLRYHEKSWSEQYMYIKQTVACKLIAVILWAMKFYENVIKLQTFKNYIERGTSVVGTAYQPKDKIVVGDYS